MDSKNKETTPPDDTNASYDKYIDPDYQNKQKKKRMLMISISAIAALLIISIVALIAFSLSSNNQSEVTDPPETTVSAHDCTLDEVCFNDYFLLCQPATYKTESAESSAEYEVLGIQEVGCLVKFRYISTEEPELSGKEMVCDLDNEIEFYSAVQLAFDNPDDYECEGELKSYLFSED